ncbi:MAG TPA: Arc family DNA-binding protein [Planctomycetota bacterium]|nr:Arc family DNA-binding protein [Planctomycetota bacterium]
MAEPKPADAADEPAEEAGSGRRSRKPFLLRLPPELMDELRGWASAELRSLNGHIEYLLREAVKRRRS